jgi:hypothetical protein
MGWPEEVEAGWQALADEVLTGMKEWRLRHPRASLREIEAALDERLSRVRARLLQDLALASAARDVAAAGPGERPLCPGCGLSLEGRGRHRRELRTYHDRTIALERSYAVCPACEVGVFPPG